MHLVTVLLQIILDAALEEVQLGLQLLGEGKHAVLALGQVCVVAQKTQPGAGDTMRAKIFSPCAPEHYFCIY